MTVAQEKGVADHTVEYRVTQKFKTFVVFGRKTAVRKRALQKRLVFKLIPDASLEFFGRQKDACNRN